MRERQEKGKKGRRIRRGRSGVRRRIGKTKGGKGKETEDTEE